MSVGLPQTLPIPQEMMLFSDSIEESSEFISCEFSSQEGELKSLTKNYTFTPKESPLLTKEGGEFSKLYGDKHDSFNCNAKTSPFQFLSKGADSTKILTKHTSTFPQTKALTTKLSGTSDNLQNLRVVTPLTHEENQSVQKQTLSDSPKETSQKPSVEIKNTARQWISQEKKEDSTQKIPHLLASRQWSKEETKEWWELRYHQRQKGDDGQNKENRDQQHGDQEEGNLTVVDATQARVTQGNESPKRKVNDRIRPTLKPPSIGVFALYYILTKIGIFSDGTSNFAYKKEIELIDLETTEAHRKRLDDLKEAFKKEQESASWGVAVQVFSWIASFFAMITGAILIATGVGAVAGAMLIAGSLIQVSNQIMELSGGWKKIADLLPGDDSERKRAVLSWIQIGIAVLCLILSGVGMIWGGYAQVGAAFSSVTGYITGVAAMGNGASTIGQGVSGFLFKDKMGDIRRYEMQLAQLKHKRKDLMEKVELGVERLEQLFEDLARSLDFEEELFLADQMLYR